MMKEAEKYCYDCIHNEVCQWQPREYCDFKEKAQPVKHARWEICCDGYYPYCSNCKNEPQGREMTDFCPNCGCRMDGDGDE